MLSPNSYSTAAKPVVAVFPATVGECDGHQFDDHLVVVMIKQRRCDGEEEEDKGDQ